VPQVVTATVTSADLVQPAAKDLGVRVEDLPTARGKEHEVVGAGAGPVLDKVTPEIRPDERGEDDGPPSASDFGTSTVSLPATR
jgi:hypothetical protein